MVSNYILVGCPCFVAYRLVIDYSLIIGNNQWLINWLPIDYLLITHWFHWCHRLVMSGLIQQERSLSTWSLSQWTVKGTQFLLACATADISKESEREDWLCENVTSWIPFMCCLAHNLYFLTSLPNAWYDTGYVLSGLETTAQCIKSGFLLLQKEAKTRKWKALKNILKVSEFKTRTFQLLYARENRHYLD